MTTPSFQAVHMNAHLRSKLNTPVNPNTKLKKSETTEFSETNTNTESTGKDTQTTKTVGSDSMTSTLQTSSDNSTPNIQRQDLLQRKGGCNGSLTIPSSASPSNDTLTTHSQISPLDLCRFPPASILLSSCFYPAFFLLQSCFLPASILLSSYDFKSSLLFQCCFFLNDVYKRLFIIPLFTLKQSPRNPEQPPVSSIFSKYTRLPSTLVFPSSAIS